MWDVRKDDFMIAKMRTIPQLVREAKAEDPNTPLNEHFIRCLVKRGEIKTVTVNRKTLISVSAFNEYMNRVSDEPGGSFGKIRKIM